MRLADTDRIPVPPPRVEVLDPEWVELTVVPAPVPYRCQSVIGPDLLSKHRFASFVAVEPGTPVPNLVVALVPGYRVSVGDVAELRVTVTKDDTPTEEPK